MEGDWLGFWAKRERDSWDFMGYIHLPSQLWRENPKSLHVLKLYCFTLKERRICVWCVLPSTSIVSFFLSLVTTFFPHFFRDSLLIVTTNLLIVSENRPFIQLYGYLAFVIKFPQCSLFIIYKKIVVFSLFKENSPWIYFQSWYVYFFLLLFAFFICFCRYSSICYHVLN